ncbi:xylose repressor [Arthrobacter sp. Hiyo4]|nr:xylose repressor [Arthrobacter sp. Hiyo4]
MSTASRLPATASDPDPSRRNNLALIAALVHHHGVLSRAELTRRTGLNRSTVGTLVGQLVALGLVFEAAPSGEAQVGRPSPDVRPDPSTAALAVNPEVDAVTIGLVSLGGKVQKKIRFATERIPTAREAVNIAAAVIAGMRSELDASYRIVGIGMAVPGLVNRADGVVRRAPHLGWRDEPVARMLAEATGYPCLADNDATLGAEAELIFGAGAGRGNLIYLNGGASGIGGGVIADGAVLRGAGGYAGELGHTFVRTDGQTCHCGASGCLETEVSQSRLFDLAGLGGGDASQLEAALRSKDSAELAGRSPASWATWASRCVTPSTRSTRTLLSSMGSSAFCMSSPRTRWTTCSAPRPWTRWRAWQRSTVRRWAPTS